MIYQTLSSFPLEGLGLEESTTKTEQCRPRRKIQETRVILRQRKGTEATQTTRKECLGQTVNLIPSW